MTFAHSLFPRPEERFLNRVSKDEASWFEWWSRRFLRSLLQMIKEPSGPKPHDNHNFECPSNLKFARHRLQTQANFKFWTFETRSFAPLLTMRFALKPEMITW
jgi:hypothetical protein